MDMIYMTFNCRTSLHSASYSLVENRGNIAYHQGTSFNEPMLTHHLEVLSCTKAGSEHLPTCNKLQVASRCWAQVELASCSRKAPTPLEFRLCGKQDLLPTGSCPSAWLCLRWLWEDRRSQETSLHTEATDG